MLDKSKRIGTSDEPVVYVMLLLLLLLRNEINGLMAGDGSKGILLRLRAPMLVFIDEVVLHVFMSIDSY